MTKIFGDLDPETSLPDTASMIATLDPTGTPEDVRILIGDLRTLLGGGGGGGIEAGIYADRPAPTTEDKAYLPTDGRMLYRDTGAAWQPFGPLMPVKEPALSGWTWDNQGAASVSYAGGAISVLTGNVTASHALYRALTVSAPLKVTIGFMFAAGYGTGPSCGVLLRQSSTGKAHAHRWWQNSGNAQIAASTYTTLAGGATNVLTQALAMSISPIRWVQLHDDGTNFRFKISPDGINWVQWYQTGRTSFLPSYDQWGIEISGVLQGGTGSGEALAVVVHAEEVSA